MKNKAELRIERFGNGISCKWRDAETNEELSSKVALSGNEEKCIGGEIWTDITEFFEANSTNNILVKIEYEEA